jgi:glycosyltransferase involved in cell wall biosynthesis/SAM-dependent methyltransferase
MVSTPALARLRVLFLASRDWYHPATTGGDITLWENARYLASVGHDVTFVAARYADAAPEELLDGIKVVRLGGLHSLWLRTFVYYLSRGRGRYDVVVAEGFGGSRIPRLAPLYVREPIITEWHQVHRDLFAVQYPRILNGPLNILEHATAWVHRNTLVRAGTEEWRRAFPRIGFKPENVFVLPVSLREEWLGASNGHLPITPTVVWIGKLRRYKSPDHAIRAMVEVVKRIPQARLILAIRRDDLKYERELIELVDKLLLAKHVEFRFNVSEKEKRELLGSARALVVPSVVEGFGIVVLEANACGVPVIASSGVPEGAVRDDMNGLRYPYGDITALSAGISRVLLDDQLHARLSAAGREFARGFAWGKVGAQYAAVVQGAAARPESVGPQMLTAVRRSLRDQVSSLGLSGPAARVVRAISSSDPRTVLSNARYRRRGAPDGLPVPPADLVFLVAGTTSISWFLQGGALAAETIREAMARRGVAIEELGAILDFGCGCGRVLRHWNDLPRGRVFGTDYSPKLIEWCRQNLPFADVGTNHLEPPLAYGDSSFDLVYAFSVLTHLTHELQVPWLRELSRIIRPGGHLLISTHGEAYAARLSPDESKRFAAGELVVKNNLNAPGSNTCAAYHPFAYVRDRLASGLELVEFVPTGARGNPRQDLYVLRKPDRALDSGLS